MARRSLTYAELTSQAMERFGEDPFSWGFRCPHCGDVATPKDFARVDGDPGRAGQECIGRVLAIHEPSAERGCNWTAYGLIPGPWEVTLSAEGDKPERTLWTFPLAEVSGG